MENFWDFSVWGAFNLLAVILIALLIANIFKKRIKFMQKSLIPTSVLAGLILLLISVVYNAITGNVFFNLGFFGGNGSNSLETITYHMLAIGFIASTLKSVGGKITKERSSEILNTGVTTVSSYVIQAIVGMVITILAALVIPSLLSASGVLLAFGYGQGPGQALNYGNIYETQFGFVGGRSFGLTIAAFGFIMASIGGVIHLHIVKKRHPEKFVQTAEQKNKTITIIDKAEEDGGLGKLTIQIALISITYLVAYGIMFVFGTLLPSLKSVVYGFNFLFGVLIAILVKSIINVLKKKNVIKNECTDNYLLSHISNVAFDLMVVAGIAAIRLDILKNYWGIMIILAVVGAVVTYFYNYFVAKKLFPSYTHEQFLAMYGMLTGTASTGIILLREIDPELTGKASSNLVYQNLPAMLLGFPMMFLATYAPQQPYIALGILVAGFIVLNILLFRSKIFKKKNVNNSQVVEKQETIETTQEQ